MSQSHRRMVKFFGPVSRLAYFVAVGLAVNASPAYSGFRDRVADFIRHDGIHTENGEPDGGRYLGFGIHSVVYTVDEPSSGGYSRGYSGSSSNQISGVTISLNSGGNSLNSGGNRKFSHTAAVEAGKVCTEENVAKVSKDLESYDGRVRNAIDRQRDAANRAIASCFDGACSHNPELKAMVRRIYALDFDSPANLLSFLQFIGNELGNNKPLVYHDLKDNTAVIYQYLARQAFIDICKSTPKNLFDDRPVKPAKVAAKLPDTQKNIAVKPAKDAAKLPTSDAELAAIKKQLDELIRQNHNLQVRLESLTERKEPKPAEAVAASTELPDEAKSTTAK